MQDSLHTQASGEYPFPIVGHGCLFHTYTNTHPNAHSAVAQWQGNFSLLQISLGTCFVFFCRLLLREAVRFKFRASKLSVSASVLKLQAPFIQNHFQTLDKRSKKVWPHQPQKSRCAKSRYPLGNTLCRLVDFNLLLLILEELWWSLNHFVHVNNPDDFEFFLFVKKVLKSTRLPKSRVDWWSYKHGMTGIKQQARLQSYSQTWIIQVCRTVSPDPHDFLCS